MNSTAYRTGHLTEEELYDLLDQPREAATVHVHLSVCNVCAHEFAAVRASLDGFRTAATDLAQAHFHPVLQVPGGFFSGLRKSMMGWPMGLVAAGVMIAGSVTMIHRPAAAGHLTTASVTAAPLESDEALLESVNQDLSTSVPPSLAPLSVASTDGAEAVSKKTN